jgi:hypothetical protein
MPTGPYAPSDPNSYVGIGVQSARGTGVAPTLWVPFLPSVELDHAQTINRIFEAGSAGQVSYPEKVSHMPTGKFIFLARPQVSAKLGAYLLGVDTPSGSAPTTHVETDDFHTDYLSIEQNLADDAIERFVDCAIAELVFACDIDNPAVRCTGTWIGCTPAWQGAATAESYETDRPFLIFDGAFTVDGSLVTNVRKFTLTVTLHLSAERIAKVTPEYLVKTGLECSLELENLVTTNMSDEYRKVQYGATGNSAVQSTATAGAFIADFTYGAGAGVRELKLEVPLLDYDDAKYTALDPGGSEAVKVTRTARGRRTAAGASPLVKITGKTADSAAYVS